MSTGLKAVGYWFEPGFGERWPEPSLLVDAGWCVDDRPRIVAYLRMAPKLRDCLGYARCRFAGVPDSDMGTGDLSDGSYIWPEGLWLYVERFSVRLPDDMVDHMRARDFTISSKLDAVVLGELEIDTTYWEDWAARAMSLAPK